MTGISDDLRATRIHVARGSVSETYARSQVERGERWLKGLGPRISHPGFAEEVEAVSFELAELKGVISDRFKPKVIRLLWIPKRVSKTQAVQPMAESMANVLALQHAQALGIDPGRLLEPKKTVLPSIEVLRYDQGWVNRRGRARVEVAYELVVGGQHVLMGSRRCVMRQADWAVMCDAFGQLPELERLTGLAKRRALYKVRKARRKPIKQKAGVRWRQSNHQRQLAILGAAMASHLWKHLMQPSHLERMLTRYPAER
jgi:hypothetical protein